jgi:predicted nucleic acid-binding protein
MRICIDSCIFIHGLQGNDPATRRLITLISPTLQLVIPRLVAQEVTRNLQSLEQVRRFYRLFHEIDWAFIVDEPVPTDLVEKYVHLGLPAKADAFIGAFAEWMEARYLISDNRHFLRELRTDAFDVLDAASFVARWEADTL